MIIEQSQIVILYSRLLLKKLIVSELIRTILCFKEIYRLSEMLKLLSTTLYHFASQRFVSAFCT
jgi:hypothetical protein